MKCKIRIISEIPIFQRCQPVVGKIYDADYSPYKLARPASAVIIVNGKKVLVRQDEFELVEEEGKENQNDRLQ